MGTTGSLERLDTTGGVLEFVRVQREVADEAERDIARAAATWIAQHSVDANPLSVTSLAGEGAPDLDEFCIAEFAAVLGLSTDSGRLYLADVIELRYRLPSIWARLTTGDLVVWKARRIAQSTRKLPQEGARYVDHHLAPFAHRLRPCELDRAVEAAEARFDPEAAAERAAGDAEGRKFFIGHDQPTATGLVEVGGPLDVADALDLETAISREAHALLELGSEESLDVRRSQALGVIARQDTLLDLGAPGAGDGTDQATDGPEVPVPARRAPVRVVNLYVHLRPGDPLAEIENTGSTVLIEQVRSWCQTSHTTVTVRPVIDLNQPLTCQGYRPSQTLREQVILRDRTCVFPGCSRPARRADLDHIDPYDQGGETSTENIGPALPTPSPVENADRLVLPDAGARHLRMDLTPRPRLHPRTPPQHRPAVTIPPRQPRRRAPPGGAIGTPPRHTQSTETDPPGAQSLSEGSFFTRSARRCCP